MMQKDVTYQRFEWQDLDDARAYEVWRANRLKAAEINRARAPVEVGNLQNPTESEINQLARRCDETNFALYASDASDHQPPLGRFAAAFGLQVAETHRSADGSGIVALEVTGKAAQAGYIPYSPRGMNWHTDGYYNAPDQRICAFLLHCLRPAANGGANRFLDPEILYIRLRDTAPEHLRALIHPGAMTIPQNREPDGTLRPVSVGPVFFGDPDSGRLQMRYTARNRSIAWRDDPATRDARACLRSCLSQDDPLIMRVTLGPGQGVLSNNVLHDRTGFQDRQGTGTCTGRLMLRVRFHNRVKGNKQWPS